MLWCWQFTSNKPAKTCQSMWGLKTLHPGKCEGLSFIWSWNDATSQFSPLLNSQTSNLHLIGASLQNTTVFRLERTWWVASMTANKGSNAHCIMWLLQQSSVNCFVHNVMLSDQTANIVPNTYAWYLLWWGGGVCWDIWDGIIGTVKYFAPNGALWFVETGHKSHFMVTFIEEVQCGVWYDVMIHQRLSLTAADMISELWLLWLVTHTRRQQWS